MKVGDIVALKEEWKIKDVYYGPGVITSMIGYPQEDFISYRVQWSGDFSFHREDELEVISEA